MYAPFTANQLKDPKLSWYCSKLSDVSEKSSSRCFSVLGDDKGHKCVCTESSREFLTERLYMHYLGPVRVLVIGTRVLPWPIKYAIHLWTLSYALHVRTGWRTMTEIWWLDQVGPLGASSMPHISSSQPINPEWGLDWDARYIKSCRFNHRSERNQPLDYKMIARKLCI